MKFYALSFSLLIVLIVFAISCNKDDITTKHVDRFSGVLQMDPKLQSNVPTTMGKSFDSSIAARTSTYDECDVLIDVGVNFSHRENCDGALILYEMGKRLARALPSHLSGIDRAMMEADGLRVYGRKMFLKSYFMFGGSNTFRNAVATILNREREECVVGEIHVTSVALHDNAILNSCFNTSNGGGGGTTTTPEQCEANYGTAMLGSSTQEVVSEEIEEIDATNRRIKKNWVIYKAVTGLWSFVSHDVLVQKKVQNRWTFTGIEHHSVTLVGENFGQTMQFIETFKPEVVIPHPYMAMITVYYQINSTYYCNGTPYERTFVKDRIASMQYHVSD